MSNMKFKSVSIFVLALALSAFGNKNNEFEDKLSLIKNEIGVTYSLNDVAPVKAEKVCFYGPYTPYSKINEVHDLNYLSIVNDFVSEGEVIAVFVTKKGDSKPYSVKRKIMDFSEHTNKRNEECMDITVSEFKVFHTSWATTPYTCLTQDLLANECRHKRSKLLDSQNAAPFVQGSAINAQNPQTFVCLYGRRYVS